MTTSREVKRLSNKLSYQGQSLRVRINQAVKQKEATTKLERSCTKNLLKAKLGVIAADERLSELLEVARINNQEWKP